MSVSTDPRIGSELLGYRIEALLGRGGMGVVYRAYDPRLKRNVALKLVAPELSGDERFRTRFLAETELAASLEHPNVVPVYDAGEVEGQLYLAMRYVEGSDLKRLLKDEGPLAPPRALAICAQVADALDAAHTKGLVHRDVKPSNVLLDSSEHVYLADFGLTRRLAEQGIPIPHGLSLGTPAYVAPEQIAGEEVDGRADVYSLGCLLFECLSGEPPFRRDSELAVLWAHLQEEPPSPAGYPDLAPVLAKALAKQPAERYASCAELVEAAREALGIAEPARPFWSRGPVVVALGLALIAAALLTFFLSQGGAGPAKPSTKPTLAPKVDSLQRIDPKTNELVATIELGSNPSAVAVGEGAVWITDRDDRTVSRIDPKTNAVSKTGAAGSAPTQAVAGEGAVWVSNPSFERTGQLVRLDPNTLKIVSTLQSGSDEDFCGPAAVGEGGVWVATGRRLIQVGPDDTVLGNVDLGPQGCGQILVAGAGAVWLAANVYSRGVIRVDPVELKVAANIPLPFVAADIAAERQGVWVVDTAGDSVVRIDPNTNRAAGTVRVGDGPFAVAAGEDGVWVANVDDGTVSRIDPNRRKVVATIRVGPRPTDIAAGEGGVWVIAHPR